jgi:hypothetical protein
VSAKTAAAENADTALHFVSIAFFPRVKTNERWGSASVLSKFPQVLEIKSTPTTLFAVKAPCRRKLQLQKTPTRRFIFVSIAFFPRVKTNKRWGSASVLEIKTVFADQGAVSAFWQTAAHSVAKKPERGAFATPKMACLGHHGLRHL